MIRVSKVFDEPGMERRIRAFYTVHSPDKVGKAAELAQKYRNREGELFAKLYKRYNVPVDEKGGDHDDGHQPSSCAQCDRHVARIVRLREKCRQRNASIVRYRIALAIAIAVIAASMCGLVGADATARVADTATVLLEAWPATVAFLVVVWFVVDRCC